MVPEILLRISPSELEKLRGSELRRLRLMAHRTLIQTESEADKKLLRDAMDMITQELERRVIMYEAKGLSG